MNSYLQTVADIKVNIKTMSNTDMEFSNGLIMEKDMRVTGSTASNTVKENLSKMIKFNLEFGSTAS